MRMIAKKNMNEKVNIEVPHARCGREKKDGCQ